MEFVECLNFYRPNVTSSSAETQTVRIKMFTIIRVTEPDFGVNAMSEPIFVYCLQLYLHTAGDH